MSWDNITLKDLREKRPDLIEEFQEEQTKEQLRQAREEEEQRRALIEGAVKDHPNASLLASALRFGFPHAKDDGELVFTPGCKTLAEVKERRPLAESYLARMGETLAPQPEPEDSPSLSAPQKKVLNLARL